MRVFSFFIPLALVFALGTNLQPDFNDKILAKKQQMNKLEMTLNHRVMNGDLYVECIVPNFNFSQEQASKKNGDGHLVLYLDGAKVDEIYRAAFIIKDLPAGKHKLKVQVVHNDNTPYKSLEKEIEVEIK